jgi:hypothetical protein
VNNWNDFIGNWSAWDKKTISTKEFTKLAEEATKNPEALDIFKEIDSKVSSWEIKVI